MRSISTFSLSTFNPESIIFLSCHKDDLPCGEHEGLTSRPTIVNDANKKVQIPDYSNFPWLQSQKSQGLPEALNHILTVVFLTNSNYSMQKPVGND